MFRILMIDDSKAVHAYIRHCFNGRADIQVHGVFNGAEALNLLKTDNGFDVLLLDWEMPVLDGPQTLLRLRAAEFKTPVIMMTSRNSADDIRRMLESGATEYIMKPFTNDILFDKISAVTQVDFSNVA